MHHTLRYFHIEISIIFATYDRSSNNLLNIEKDKTINI